MTLKPRVDYSLWVGFRLRRFELLGYFWLTLLVCLGWFCFVIPWSAVSEWGTHTVGDGLDEISFIYIFQRLGENLWTWSRPIWDGRMLYPATDSLIYSETMTLPAFVFHGLYRVTNNFVLSYHLLLFIICWGNAALMYWCSRKWFSRPVAMTLALFFTYSVIRLTHLRHTHCFPQMGFPLAAGFLLNWERTRKMKWAAWAGFAVALQYYLSVTLGSILTVSLIPYILWRLRDPASRRAAIRPFAGALLVFTLVAFPLGSAYVHCSLEHRFVRTLDNTIAYGANLKSFFVVPPEHRYSSWLTDGLAGGEKGARHEKALFLGFAGYLLLFLGIRSLNRRYPKNPDKKMIYLSLGFVLLVAMGRNVGLYNLLYYIFPLMKGMRTPSRFSFSYLFLSLFLMGFGLTALLEWVKPRWQKALLFSTIVGIMILDNQFYSPRFPLVPTLENAAKYLSRTPDEEPVIFIPMRSTDRKQAMQMYYSLFHPHPIANGYSGFLPPIYNVLVGASYEWQDGKSKRLLALLSQHDIPYLVLEKDAFSPERSRELVGESLSEGFVRVYEDAGAVVLKRTKPN